MNFGTKEDFVVVVEALLAFVDFRCLMPWMSIVCKLISALAKSQIAEPQAACASY
jgi:hypothetical protein